MNDLTRSVAQRVHALRTGRGWSISELGRQAGLSKTTLSALENGTGNPTVDTVWALAQALEVPVGDLMQPTHERLETPRVLRSGEGAVLAGSVLDVRLLAQPTGMARMELLSASMKGSDTRHSAPHAPGTVEHLIVRSGQIQVGPEHDPVDLGEGDYVMFDADVPHLYRSLTDVAEVLIVICYPGTLHGAVPT